MSEIRLANINDIDKIMICINDAKRFLKESGSTQWNGPEGYPDTCDLISDINNKSLYVYDVDNKIAGCAAFLGYEDEYDNPVGEWLSDTKNYLTIHRIAVSNEFRGKGIAKSLFNYAIEYCKNNNIESIRVDTHEINKVMQGLCNNMGFTLCGHVIYKRIKKDPKRLIYEKIIKK